MVRQIIHSEHFDRNLFMRSFGFDDSWDVLLVGESFENFIVERGSRIVSLVLSGEGVVLYV